MLSQIPTNSTWEQRCSSHQQHHLSLQKQQTVVWKKAGNCQHSAFLHSNKSCAQASKYSSLPLAHIHLWIFICENIFTLFSFWQISEKKHQWYYSHLAYCLLNNSSLHPTDCFLWRETNILTNTTDDIWNVKSAYWVNERSPLFSKTSSFTSLMCSAILCQIHLETIPTITLKLCLFKSFGNFNHRHKSFSKIAVLMRPALPGSDKATNAICLHLPTFNLLMWAKLTVISIVLLVSLSGLKISYGPYSLLK